MKFLKNSVKNSTLQRIKFRQLAVGELNTFVLTLQKFLMTLLQTYTAQLIVCLTLDSYFPNHIRCCAGSPDKTHDARKIEILLFIPTFVIPMP